MAHLYYLTQRTDLGASSKIPTADTSYGYAPLSTMPPHVKLILDLYKKRVVGL